MISDNFGKRVLAIHRRVKNIHFCNIKPNFNQSEYYTLTKIEKMVKNENESPVGFGVSMSTLAKNVGVSPPMTTKTINALVSRNVVERVNDSGDRRGVKVCFTEEGYSLFQEDRETRGILLERIFNRFGEERSNEFFSMSEELLEIAEQEIKKMGNEQK